MKTMNFNINDTIKLKIDVPEHDLKKGVLGVVVMNFIKPREAYRIEFTDSDGRTVAEVNLLPDQIEKY